MKPDFYKINMQKILFVAKELHKMGYENLRIIPSLSPSGMSWRCRFISSKVDRNQGIYASNWIQENFEINDKEIEVGISDLVNVFVESQNDFLQKCIGKNTEYTEWYSQMLEKLKSEELPYAFSDYFSPTDFWETSLKNKIKTLPNEERYYMV